MKLSQIEKEKRTIERMIRLYCRKREKRADLCQQCEALIVYAHQRLDGCPFGEAKPTCKQCTVHCYKPVERERIRQIMRYVGPRMVYLSPADFIRHLFRR